MTPAILQPKKKRFRSPVAASITHEKHDAPANGWEINPTTPRWRVGLRNEKHRLQNGLRLLGHFLFLLGLLLFFFVGELHATFGGFGSFSFDLGVIFDERFPRPAHRLTEFAFGELGPRRPLVLIHDSFEVFLSLRGHFLDRDA